MTSGVPKFTTSYPDACDIPAFNLANGVASEFSPVRIATVSAEAIGGAGKRETGVGLLEAVAKGEPKASAEIDSFTERVSF
jgi:hypothetical protein